MYEYADDLEGKSMDSLETKSFDRFFSSEGQSGYSDLTAIVNPRILKSIYMSEDWVYILIDRIASKLAQIPWQVHKDIKPGGEEILEPALDHPLQKILDNPNPLQPSYAFKYSCITDISVTGNCLIYISRSNRWLVQIPTEIISLDITGRGDLRGFDIVGVDPMAFPVGMRTKLRPEDVAHIKRPNPSSVFWGLSPLIPGANPSLFNKYSNEYLLNFYRKGAQPGLVLEMGEEANENQAKKLLASLETAYTGRANQRRGLVLPKGVKVNNVAHTLADQQLIEYIRNNRETLINIFGVPKHELSIAEAGSLGSEEYKTALKNFWQGPLMSIGTMFETALTEKLKPYLGENYVIKLNYSNVPILQEDLVEKATLATAMLSTMTYNEVRQRVWKLPPIEGGDVLKDLQQPAFPSFPSFSSQPQIEQVSEPEVLQSFSLDEDDGEDLEYKEIPQKYSEIDFKPPEDVAKEAALGLKWRAEYGRGGTEVGVARAVQLKNKRTVLPDTIKRMVSYFARHAGEGDNKEDNGEPSAGAIAWKLWGGDPGERWSSKVNEQMTRADGSETKVVDEPEDYKKANVEAFSNYLKSEDGAWARDNASKIEEESKAKIGKVEELWLDILSKQVVEAVKVLKDQAKEKAAEIPSKVKMRKAIAKAMEELEKQWVDGYVDNLTTQMELGYNNVLEVPFNKPYLEGIEAIRSRNAEGRRQILEDRAIKTFANISKTTTERIMNRIEQGLKEAQSIADIAQGIQDIATVSAGRAMTIARTEVLTAGSIGEAEAMKDTAELIPNLVKVWLNSNDERVRGNPNGLYPDSEADHWRLMGAVVDYGEKFENGLEFPRDPRGPAGETINCRCSMLAVSADDLGRLGLKR